MTAAGAVMGPAMKVAYFVVMIAILWKLFSVFRQKQPVGLMELIALGVMFGLMR
jgi:hypothetical protein